MKELIGKKWGHLAEETKEQLFKMSNVWDGVQDGECIYDLTEILSVVGRVDCSEDGGLEYIIPNESIIYCPEDGVLDKANYNELKINEVMTVNEASEIWDKSEGAIRAAIKANKFIVGVDYRKSGRITLITKEAMERVYGEPKTE